MTAADEFAAASDALGNGRHSEALSGFRSLVESHPKWADPRVGAALALCGLGRADEAVRALLDALRDAGDRADVRTLLGRVLRDGGERRDAETCFRRALELRPDYAPALLALSQLAAERGDRWLALHYAESARDAEPESAESSRALADRLLDAELHERAAERYAAVLRALPRDDHALHGLARAHALLQHHAYALELYERLAPSPDALLGVANCNFGLGRLDAAISGYRHILSLDPANHVARNNLAAALGTAGDVSAARDLLETSVQLRPDDADALRSLGDALRETGHASRAEEMLQRALRLDPHSADAYACLGALREQCGDAPAAIQLYRTALRIRPELADAFCRLVHCLRIVCEWTDYDAQNSKLETVVREQLQRHGRAVVRPHHAMLYPLSHLQRLHVAKLHSEIYVQRAARVVRELPPFAPGPRDAPRVGYVSSDFGDHPTSHLMRSVLRSHRAVEVFCFALSPDDGSAFRSSVSKEARLVDLSGCDDARAALEIRKLHVDILVDLNGHTKGARGVALAARPAPLQAMWLGYPSSSGSPFIDYIVTDETVSPTSLETLYTEKFAYVPDSCYVGDHRRMFPHVLNRRDVHSARRNVAVLNSNDSVDCANPIDGRTLWQIDLSAAKGERVPKGVLLTERRHYGLPEDACVYCNFNQLYKIDPITFASWMTVLKRVPNSVLWLLRFPKAGEPNLRREAAEREITAERIIFSDVVSKEEHVRRGQLADVCLDTPLCNGHTTNMDILWAGTPIVTLPGETMASRVGSSQLNASGCPELIATTYEEYEDIAVRLGNDDAFLSSVRSKIENQRLHGSLFDCKDYADNLEKLYIKMWKRHMKGLAPSHIWAAEKD